MEIFLARKIFDEIVVTHGDTPLPILNTRRFDRKIIYFLTHLDTADAIRPSPQILRNAYITNVFANDLQILYWAVG